MNQAMNRVCGAVASMNCHHLFLCDNMAVTLSFDRFRAKSWMLFMLIRRFASFIMSMGIRPHVRWVRSELNPADARQGETRLRTSSPTFRHQHSHK